MADPNIDPDALARVEALDRFKQATTRLPGEPFTTWRGERVIVGAESDPTTPGE